MSFIPFKQFNYNDPKHWMKEEDYVGSYAFYKSRFGNKLDDYTIEILEILAKGPKEHQVELLNEINAKREQYYKKLLDEYNLSLSAISGVSLTESSTE